MAGAAHVDSRGEHAVVFHHGVVPDRAVQVDEAMAADRNLGRQHGAGTDDGAASERDETRIADFGRDREDEAQAPLGDQPGEAASDMGVAHAVQQGRATPVEPIEAAENGSLTHAGPVERRVFVDESQDVPGRPRVVDAFRQPMDALGASPRPQDHEVLHG